MPLADGRAAAALTRLLAAERSAIVTGDFAGLERLTRRKLELVGALKAGPDSAAALARMKAEVLRHDRLMSATRDGLRGMAWPKQSASDPLTTYGPDGAAETHPESGRRMARRV